MGDNHSRCFSFHFSCRFFCAWLTACPSLSSGYLQLSNTSIRWKETFFFFFCRFQTLVTFALFSLLLFFSLFFPPAPAATICYEQPPSGFFPSRRQTARRTAGRRLPPVTFTAVPPLSHRASEARDADRMMSHPSSGGSGGGGP